MSLRYVFAQLSAIVLLLAVNCKCLLAQPVVNDFTTIQKTFKQPDHVYGSAPLWVWHADTDSASIDFSLQEFKKNGFGGAFIHPRPGLITPYLSDEWLRLCKYAVQQGKKYGLDIWIYDENSYPSGFAGGHVNEAMPASCNQGQMLELTKTDTLPQHTDAYMYVFEKIKDSCIDITRDITSHTGKKGNYYLLKKTFYYNSDWYAGFSYVDLMVKGVAEMFIEKTFNPYAQYVGNEFGKTVPGIFSDEPNIEVQFPNSIRWTPDLYTAFKQKWHYDLEPNLVSLFEETGDWKKVRHNYYQTLLDLFIERWSKPMYAFTQKNKLQWTGHYWEHGWPSPNHGPDNMAMYAWHQRPGIDMLFNQFDEQSPNAQFGNVRSAKELSSVANQLNKRRTLCETYGGGGWELRFEDMKRLADWEFALGINTLNQHLSYMSMKGTRKYDYPPSFSYHNPWWPHYRDLNDYYKRLSLALSSGKQQNKILIIEPTTTAWMYYNNTNPDKQFEETGKQFQSFITMLEKAQVEYDLGSEMIIQDTATIKQKKFYIGTAGYDMVVLPKGIENLNDKTFRLLKAFADAGGSIVQFAPIKTIDGKRDTRLDDFYNKQYANLHVVSSVANTVQQYFTNPGFSISRNDTLGDLYHHRRVLADGELLFMSNASLTNNAAGEISSTAKQVLRLDLFSGEIKAYSTTNVNGKLSFDYNLPPAGSALFFLAKQTQKGYAKPLQAKVLTQIVNAPTKILPLDKNVLTIDFCDMAFGDSLLKDQQVLMASEVLYKYHGFSNGNPWFNAVQYKDNIIKRDTFSKGSGFTVSYYFTIQKNTSLQGLEAVVENTRLWKVLLNGVEVKPIAGKWWMDKSFSVFDIEAIAKEGVNILTLVADRMSVYAETEPVYILGNFSLQSAAKGWMIAPADSLHPGSWKQQGWPLYGHAMSYSKEIVVVQNERKNYKVQLGKWNGTVAVVKVNGMLVGNISFPPYELDITKYLLQGSNNVSVEITGSYKNTLGPFHNKPAPGLVSPWHFLYVKNYPPGSDYDLYDYGAMEDFKILSD